MRRCTFRPHPRQRLVTRGRTTRGRTPTASGSASEEQVNIVRHTVSRSVRRAAWFSWRRPFLGLGEGGPYSAASGRSRGAQRRSYHPDQLIPNIAKVEHRSPTLMDDVVGVRW